MIELLLSCGFDTLYSWVKATIGIYTLVDYFVAKKRQQPASPTLGRLGPGFLPRHLPVSYYMRLPLVSDIIKIFMDFGPYDAFPSSHVPEMVDQQNLWNSSSSMLWRG
jgi:hypothetical protein